MLESEVMNNAIMDNVANEMVVDSVAAPCVAESAKRGIDGRSFGLGALAGAAATIAVGTFLGWRRKAKSEKAKTSVDAAANQARAAMTGSNQDQEQQDFVEVVEETK